MTGRLQRQDGVALVLTLLVLVLVVALTWEAFRAGARAAQAGASGRDSIRATLLAEAGLAAARVALREDAKDNDFDTLDEVWSRAAPPIELGEGTIRVAVEDEERKIDLNRLVLPNGNAPDDQRVEVFRKLLSVLDLDPSLADAVVDWLDNDDSARSGGAESPYYLSLPFPYRAKNDLLDTVQELRLVRGFTREAFEKIRPFVTVRSTGKVNLNTAPPEVLQSLSAGRDAAEAGEIDLRTAEEIAARRSRDPFRKVEEIVEVSPLLADLYRKTRFRDLVDVRSATFHVRSTGDVGGTVRTADAVGVRAGNAVEWRYWRLE